MSGTFQLYSVTGSRNLATKKLADEKDRSVLAGTLPATARFMSMIVVHAIDSFVQSVIREKSYRPDEISQR